MEGPRERSSFPVPSLTPDEPLTVAHILGTTVHEDARLQADRDGIAVSTPMPAGSSHR